jgi:hypothetical protein
MKLSGARMAPTGHSTRQKERVLNKAPMSTTPSMASFTIVDRDMASVPPVRRLGIVTWSADAGHTRQNDNMVSEPRQSGSRNAVAISTTYLMWEVHEGRSNFRLGIL